MLYMLKLKLIFYLSEKNLNTQGYSIVSNEYDIHFKWSEKELFVLNIQNFQMNMTFISSSEVNMK